MDTALCASINGTSLAPAVNGMAVALGEAGAALEAAAWAPDSGSCRDGLTSAAWWMRAAQERAGQMADNSLVDRTACAAATLEGYAQQVPAGTTDLQAFQAQTVAPFQGVIASISAGEWRSVTTGSGPATLGVVAAIAVTLGVAGWIDWRQTHGGYDRGPRATIRPARVYSYR